MHKQKPRNVPPLQIHEVVAFLDIKDRLEAFKEDYREVFQQFEALTEQYNAALEAAEMAVRMREVGCGPFDLFSFTTKYNAAALYDAVGPERFRELGGKTFTETQYEVDRARLEALIAAGRIEAHIVQAVRKVTPNFHKPEKAVLP
jgi:hypothetical protein